MVEFQGFSAELPAERLVLRLRPRRAAQLLWVASFAVIALGLFREWFVSSYGTQTVAQDLRHFAFNAEYCLPAWYTSMLLLLSAGLLIVVTVSGARRGERQIVHWAMLAVMFVGLSIDESTGVHEVLIEPLREGFDLSGPFYFGWVLPGMVVGTLIGLAYLPFLLGQPRRTRTVFVLAGLIYVGGALGMEMVGGEALTIYGENSLAYRIAYCTEEIMEIVGASLFATGLLGHLKRQFGGAIVLVA